MGYAFAEEQLRQGHTVIAESVNPLAVTRDARRDAAVRDGVPVLEVEVVCSDPDEHRHRAGSRSVDIPRPAAARLGTDHRAGVRAVEPGAPGRRHRRAATGGLAGPLVEAVLAADRG